LPDCKPIIINRNNESTFLKYQNEIAEMMSENLGIVRNKAGMEKSFSRLKEISKKFNDFENEYNKLKIKNAAEIALLITNSALIREESRGGHIREDFQKENPDFKIHVIQQKGKEIQFEQVRK
jgi:L-aspartate oxidase